MQPFPLTIVGNWKMYSTRAKAKDLLQQMAKHMSLPIHDVEIVVCPSFPLLSDVSLEVLEIGVKTGAQDCSPHSEGAFTGDVSAAQIRDTGCSYVIVGHSERRHGQANEQSELVARKAKAAHSVSLKTIICIGETQEEYDQGKTVSVLTKQLTESLPASSTSQNTLIAYEPVWAIGSGKTPTLPEIESVHQAISDQLQHELGQEFSILYGGSVTPENAKDLVGLPHVQGLLIGRASLSADSFISIIKQASMKQVLY